MVNLHAAKTHLSRLVDQAAAGEEIIIARAGKPVAKLVPLDTPPRPVPKAKKRKWRRLGHAEGQPYWIAPDFDELPPGFAEAFGIDPRTGGT